MDPLRHALLLLQQIIIEHKQDLISGTKKLTLDCSLILKIKQLSEEAPETPSFSDTEKVEIRSLINVLNNVQKLKISKAVHSSIGPLSIESFKCLKYLEFFSISVDKLSGLNLIKSQLETLICSRCLHYLDVLNDDNVWSALNILAFRHGKIVDIGIHFFRNCPWLKHLDLSYNNLKSVPGLQSLNNIRYLDLSFNYLEAIPVLNSKGFQNLQILLISHNYITSLTGIKHYVNLRGLDVSNNCLLDRFAIKELYNLSLLQWVNLSSNPLSFNPKHRLYAIYHIGTMISPQQFVLDSVALNVVEQKFLGRCNKLRYTNTGLSGSRQAYISGEFHGIKQIPGFKASKVREVVIKEEFEDVDENILRYIERDEQENVLKRLPGFKVSKVREVVIKEESDFIDVGANSQDNVLRNLEKEEHLESKKQVETLREKYGKDWLLGDSGSCVQDLMGIVKNTSSNSYDIPHYDIITKASLLRSQGSDNESSGVNPLKIDGSSPSTSIKKGKKVEPPEVDTTVVTVHATENNKTEINKSIQEVFDDNNYENISSEFTGPNDESSEELFVSAVEENVEDDNDSEEKEDDELSGDEPLWVVQKIDSVSKKIDDIFLILLDHELREKGRNNGKTITKWPLETIQSCVKVKSDPVTIELEFDSFRKDKRSRTYVMEYADAKVLLERLTTILESRPLSAMNQLTFKCIKCASIFSHQLKSKPWWNSFILCTKEDGSKPHLQLRLEEINNIISRYHSPELLSQGSLPELGVVCPICNSTFVLSMEEPRLPSNNGAPENSISHSPSESSIAYTLDNGCGTGGSGNSQNHAPSTIKCSAASLDPSFKSVKNIGASTPRKYESDIEIISNPSQSSIEVLDDQSRPHGGSTPGRKRSSEEKQTVVAVPQLVTVPEIQSPSNALTESSSSGSMTESVITTYETQTAVNKMIKPEGSVLEETVEEPPSNEGIDTFKSNFPSALTDDTFKNDPDTVENTKISPKDLYSYTDYTQVDPRILLYLKQNVFENKEELICLIRCHLWKSGGSDFQACMVISTESLHILQHTSTNYGDDASEWLSKEETYKLNDIKTIFPLVWYQGVGFQVKNIFYLSLLQDRKRTENLLQFFQGLSLRQFKVEKNPSSKIENQLVLALSSSIGNSPEDPTITLYTICSSISVFKDEVCHDTMRLVGLLVTNGGLHIVLGDLAWLTGSSNNTLMIHHSQHMSCLIEVERSTSILNLHFLDDAQNLEEVWCLTHVTGDEISAIIKAIQTPWEKLFPVPLQVTIKI